MAACVVELPPGLLVPWRMLGAMSAVESLDVGLLGRCARISSKSVVAFWPISL